MGQMTISEFADKLSAIMPAMMREFLRQQMKEFYKVKVTMPQFFILETLTRMGEVKMTDLAHLLNVSTAAVTGLVDRLARDGYAKREHDPDDRRVIKIKVTPKGSKIVKRIMQKRREMTINMFSKVTDQEREEYLRILTHIKEHLGEK